MEIFSLHSETENWTLAYGIYENFCVKYLST